MKQTLIWIGQRRRTTEIKKSQKKEKSFLDLLFPNGDPNGTDFLKFLGCTNFDRLWKLQI